VTGVDLVTGLELQLGDGRLERLRRKVQLRAAGPADQVVVVVSHQFISKMTAADLGGFTTPFSARNSSVR